MSRRSAGKASSSTSRSGADSAAPEPRSQEEVEPAHQGVSILVLLKRTVQRWSKGNAPTQSAALAFYTLFSLGPLLMLVVAIAGFFFGNEATHREITEQARLLFGSRSAETLNGLLESAAQPSGIRHVGLLGGVGLLLGATAVFGQLQEALNAIWNVKPERGNMVKEFFAKRLLSFALVVVIGFLLLVSLVLSAGLSALSRHSEDVLKIPREVLSVGEFLISGAILIALFALIYRILPDVQIAWRDVLVGAAVTAALFSVGKFLIGFYIGRSDVASPYGVAGSLVLLLMWVYYSSMLLLFGAGVTRVWSQHRRGGAEPLPEKGAETRTAAPAASDSPNPSAAAQPS